MVISKFFCKKWPQIIGMIHLNALPGTPKNTMIVKDIIRNATKELEIYLTAGVDGLLIENMHDIPYVRSHLIGPEVTAIMSLVSAEIRKLTPRNIPCGVQILAGANKEALAVALAADLQFIRCEGYVFGHVADEGWINACAGKLLRYRKLVGADHILVFTDIKKKHSAHAVTADLDIGDTASAAEFFLSDGLILTGTETGSPVNVNDLEKVKERSHLPVIIGSGVTVQNIDCYSKADAFIVGSYFKKNGKWNEEIDIGRVSELMSHVLKLRS